MDARAALLCHTLAWPVVKPGCEDENKTDAQVPGMGRGPLGKEMVRVSSALRPRAKERAQCLRINFVPIQTSSWGGSCL